MHWYDSKNYLRYSNRFSRKSADVRWHNYRTGTRKPKADLTNALARRCLMFLHRLLMFPDADSYIGLMHLCLPLKIFTVLLSSEADGGGMLKRSTRTKAEEAYELPQNAVCLERTGRQTIFQKKSTEKNTITGVTIYPEFDTTQRWAKVPSTGIRVTLSWKHSKTT